MAEAQREAGIVKKRLEAGETRRQTLLLQKQMEKDKKKAEQQKARYEKEISKLAQSQKIKAIPMKQAFSEYTNHPLVNHSSLSDNVNEGRTIQGITTDPNAAIKNKARMLNPLRWAHKVFTNTDGVNNPNIEGQNNGLNAWMDANLHHDEMDRELINKARYAKYNADYSCSFDIDDVPIRGPLKLNQNEGNLS